MVSILMPAKDAAAFLEITLLSIQAQDESDWELLIINDHSVDETKQIAQEFAKNDSRITILDSEGKGIIPALQLGFAQVKGDLITRMDADDVMPSGKIRSMKSALLKVGIGHVVTGKVKYFSDGRLGDGYRRYEAWLNQLADANAHYSAIYKECVIPSSGWMMYRKDLEDIGGFDSLDYPEDYDLAFRMYAKQLKILPLNLVIHYWRDHPARTSRNSDIYSGHYFKLKVKYFLANDYDSTKQLALWGAGKKGKELAQLLILHQIDFQWVSNNKNKIGHIIYGHKIREESYILSNANIQIILAISAPEAVTDIELKLKMVEGEYYWFC